MVKSQDTWSRKFLRALSLWVIEKPKLLVWPQLILFLVGIFYTITQLEFSTDRNDLVGSDKKYHQIFLNFREEFPQEDDLVVLVESGNLEKNRQFVERLGARLLNDPAHFTNVFWKGDLKSLGPKSLLFMDTETLISFRDSIRTYLQVLQFFSETESLNDLFRRVNRQFAAASVKEKERETNPDGLLGGDSSDKETHAKSAKEKEIGVNALLSALPSLHVILQLSIDALERPGDPTAPPLSAFFPDESMDSGSGSDAGYITYDQGSLFLLTCQAASPEVISKSVERLRMWTRLTEQELPGVNVGITGEPVLEYEEMRQSQNDTTSASILALSLVMTIFLFGYHETRRPIKTTLCLAVGLAFTMAFTTLVIGRLNILTITFAPILIGLAIDFGVHLVSRYEEELISGASPEKAIQSALENTGQGILTGALTTAFAFLAMLLTDFRGIQEMGIITGGGMILCLIPMITLLPIWLIHGSRRGLVPADLPIPHSNRNQNHIAKLPLRTRLENKWLKSPRMTVGIIVLLSILCIPSASKVTFDYNLLNMQSENLPAVTWEGRLIQSASKSVLYAAVMTDDLQGSLELEEKIKALDCVSKIDSMTSVLSDPNRPVTEATQEKLDLAREIQIALSGLSFSIPSQEPISIEDLSRTLWSFQGYVGSAADRINSSQVEMRYLSQTLEKLKSTVIELRKQLFEKRLGANSAERVMAFQNRFLNEIRETFEALKRQDLSAPMGVQDLPDFLRSRFIGKTGKHLIYVYPKKNIWDRDNQEEFVQALRTIAPNVTGTPIQLYEYTTLLKTSYENAALYALAIIIVLAGIKFRKFTDVILCLIPTLFGFTWMLGLMGWLQIPFNPANIMTLPLVVGIGVTNAIHILGRYREDGSVTLFSGSSGKAVLVSGLTTIAGFGSLMMAEHQGIASLGAMMSLGTLACMSAALVALPSILACIQPSKELKKKTI